MTIMAIHAAAVAAIAIAGMTAGAAAQTSAPDPHHSEITLAQAAPSSESGAMGQGQPPQAGMTQPGTAQPGMAQPGMMGGDMMRGMMQGGMSMMGARGHMMKMMFAIADGDRDGALSFDEVSAIHKRIFDAVDADKNGKATREELQDFMRD